MTRVNSIVMSVVGVVLGALAVGCGPSPAYYEPEPRVPVGYEPNREPASSAELQAQAQVQVQPQPAQGDVSIGETSADEYTDTDPSALTEFKPALDGHGQWVDDGTYGTVWVPASSEVGTDFEPYVTAGHWTYDDDQSWVWVSDYDWGWAPFHYGRWVKLPGRGWAWIPGRVYSGAWVVWRTGPADYDYVGWAPAPPEWYWWNGYAVGWTFGWYHPYYWYCNHDYIYDRGWRAHAVYGGSPSGAAIEGHTHPYVPPPPSRVAATPTVNGPSHVVAHPRVNGPRPSDIGVKQGAIVHPPSDNDRLARAQAYATPSTAKKYGAAAPVQTRPRPYEGVAGQPGYALGRGDRTSPSVASRLEPVARAPQVQTSPPNPGRPMPNAFAGRVGSQPSTSTSIRNDTPSAIARPTTAPVQPRTAPPIQSQPSIRPSAPTYAQPSPRYAPSAPSAPTFSRSSPTVHAQPSVQAPTFHSAPPSVSRSAPTVHSAPSVSSHSSAPSVHSAPSRSAPSVRSSGGRRR